MQVAPSYYIETNTTSWYTTNTAGYWSHYGRQVAALCVAEPPLEKARRNLAFCREVSLDAPTRLRPQTAGMKSEYFVARNRGGSSGRPGYRRRRTGGRLS